MNGKTGICVYTCVSDLVRYGQPLPVTNKTVRHHGQTCHAGIRTSSGLSQLISNYGGEHKYSSQWWDYITGPECFYQDFFKIEGWEKITDTEGQVFAFKVPDILMKDGMSLLFYAFLIESRVPKDKVANLNVWGKMVELGIPKKLAHIMMYNISEKDGVLSIGGIFTGGWSGSHQVACDNGSHDWYAFRNNNVKRYVDKEEYSRKLWSRPTVDMTRILNNEYKPSFGTPTTTTTTGYGGRQNTTTSYILNREGLSALCEHIETTIKAWAR